MIEFDKYKNVKGLTKEQQDEICYLISEWYLDWKHNLINWNNKSHRLGFAKEILKIMICGSPELNKGDFSDD